MIAANLADALIVSVGWIIMTILVVAVFDRAVKRTQHAAHMLAIYNNRHDPATCEWCDRYPGIATPHDIRR